MGMKKIDLPLLFDSAFYAASFFFLSLAALRYFRVALAVALTAAALLSLACFAGAALFLSRKHRRRALTKAEREEREKLMLHLALEQPEKVRLALLTAIAKDGKEANCRGDALEAEGTLLLPFFTMQPVSADAVARLIREHGKEPFALLCNALTPEAEKLLSSFGKRAVCGDEVYALFSRTDTFPSPLILGELPRTGPKEAARRAFGKRNARPFFVCGSLLLLMSLFTLYPAYYLAVGGTLLLAAVLVRAFGYA